MVMPSGGNGGQTSGADGLPATVNTGSGGGGGCAPVTSKGGAGASGIVIIRYLT